MAKNVVERKKINGVLQAIYRATLGKLVLLDDAGMRTVADLDSEVAQFKAFTSASLDKNAQELDGTKLTALGHTNWNSGNLPVESGTWTPTIGDGGTITYISQTGRYYRIGRLVYISAIISCTVTGTVTGLYIRGLPFASNSDIASHIPVSSLKGINLSYTDGSKLSSYVLANSNGLQVVWARPSGSPVHVAATATGDVYLAISGVYLIN